MSRMSKPSLLSHSTSLFVEGNGKITYETGDSKQWVPGGVHQLLPWWMNNGTEENVSVILKQGWGKEQVWKEARAIVSKIFLKESA
jgi:hypothetical protein